MRDFAKQTLGKLQQSGKWQQIQQQIFSSQTMSRLAAYTTARSSSKCSVNLARVEHLKAPITVENVEPEKLLVKENAQPPSYDKQDITLSQRQNASDCETVEYTDGPSKIVRAGDGTKNCIAILLTKRMVEDLNEIFAMRENVQNLKKKARDMKWKATDAKYCLEEAQAQRDTAQDTNEKDHTDSDLAFLEKQATALRQAHEKLTKDLECCKDNLGFCHNQSCDHLKKVLDQAGLVGANTTVDEHYEPTDVVLDGVQVDGASSTSSESEESMMSLESLNRHVALEEIYRTRNWLHTLQIRWDSREEAYDLEFGEHCQMVVGGAYSLADSEFDRIQLSKNQKLTRALINAEGQYHDAQLRARALGVLGNYHDQESDFVDDADDGYRESFEASAIAAVDTEFIEYWREQVFEVLNEEDTVVEDEEEAEEEAASEKEKRDEERPDHKHKAFPTDSSEYMTNSDSSDETDGETESSTTSHLSDSVSECHVDEEEKWNTSTVGISDSISMVDTGKNRRKIDAWRNFCGQQI